MKIEKGIPIPPIKSAGAKKNPNSRAGILRQMAVGDSFFCKGMATTGSVRTQICTLKLEGKFTMRTVEGGVRIWRIA